MTKLSFSYKERVDLNLALYGLVDRAIIIMQTDARENIREEYLRELFSYIASEKNNMILGSEDYIELRKVILGKIEELYQKYQGLNDIFDQIRENFSIFS